MISFRQNRFESGVYELCVVLIEVNTLASPPCLHSLPYKQSIHQPNISHAEYRVDFRQQVGVVKLSEDQIERNPKPFALLRG